MPPHTASTQGGLTRRQVLKRGAAVGAASLWTTPALQVVRMSRAEASHTSGHHCVIYCIKWDFDTGVWEPLGQGVQNCLTCPDDGINSLPPQSLLDDFTISGDPAIALTVRYPASCSLLVLDSSPDEFTGMATGAGKCGSDTIGLDCSYVGPSDEEPDPNDADFTLLEIPVCDNDLGISHIEMIIQCCDPETSA